MSFAKIALGRTGHTVSRLGFGAMSLGGMFGATDEETSFATLDAALAAGIDHWDTANIYGMGISETVIGRYMAQNRPEVVLATKGSIVPGPPRRACNAYDYLRAELEGSLTRLGVSSVPLYYAHRRQPDMTPEAIAEVFARFIDEGLIAGWGMSEVAPATVRRAHAVCPLSAVQSEYSLWTRLPELGLIDTCAELGVTFVAFSPLARGMLGDTPITPDRIGEKDFRRNNPRFAGANYGFNRAAIDGFADWARARGYPVAAAALAWIMARGDHVLPIPGTRTAAHLAEWLPAADITLSPDDMAEIARLLPPGFAHGDRYSDAQMAFVERYC